MLRRTFLGVLGMLPVASVAKADIASGVSFMGRLRGIETPAMLAMRATSGRLRRTRLWALFDQLAISLLTGQITNVVIMCPPQHGKSEFWSKFFPAWWLGCRPNHRVILGSYSAGFAASWGRKTRDVVMQNGRRVGREVRDDVSGASEWALHGYDGGMVTSGYEGGIAGRPAELAIVDDPLPDAATANSKTEKDKLWTWWEEELSARIQGRTRNLPEGGRRVLLMTRRAVDDPIGRVLQLVEAGKENWAVVRLPAIAEEDESWPEYGWSRKVGEALVPELHSLKELEATRAARGDNTWAGLYQQRPYPRGGGDLKGEWFKIVPANPISNRRCRAWDCAASESPAAKQTAGVKIGKRREQDANKYHIEDVVCGRWNPGRRNQIILQTAQADGHDVPIVIEQEPGSGGIAQVDELVRLLDGYIVVRVPASRDGSKQMRADAMAAQASIGNVTMIRAPWNAQLIAEANSFPAGLIDIIDAAAHGYNWLAGQDVVAQIPAKASLVLPGNPRAFSGGPRRFSL